VTRLSIAVLASLSSTASAAANNLILLSAIPTLDEVGLGVLIALVGGAAGWAVRRRHHRREPR
jgi:hypothetical protein